MQKDIQSFIFYLKIERNYAINTQHAYSKDLQQLLRFLHSQGITSWQKINVEHLSLLMMQMRNRGVSSRSIRRCISSIRGFLTYLLNHKIVSNNCAIGLRIPKISQCLPKILDHAQINLLTQKRSHSLKELRDIAMIETLYSCGLRVSELASLNTTSVDYKQGFLQVMGKGSKTRQTPLGSAAQQAIINYLKQANITQGALFLNNKGQRVSARLIQEMVKKRALEVGIKINVYPHMLRHAAATHFLQSSHDLRSTQEFLGHKSIKSTQVYTHLDFLELSKVYDKHHPRAKK